MSAADTLQLVEAGALPDYPAELIDARMTSDYFTVFWHDRWLNSELCLTARMDVQGAALNLFFIARKQNPIGSLPVSDTMLAKLLRIDLEYWQELCGRPITPLHHWQKYRADDKIIYGHPVVIEVALDALNRREAREIENSEKARYQRLRRLREALADLGCSKAVVADDVLIERMDEWLAEHHRGQRRRQAYERALEHAARAGWFNERGRNRL